LYGATFAGGATSVGDVFEFTTGGVYSELYSFCRLPNCPDGAFPTGWLTLDSSGNLFGLTLGLGVEGDSDSGAVAFMLTPSGKESVLYSFRCNDYGGLVMDKSGNLYGTEEQRSCSRSYGTVFKLTKN
jgi:hypothetical protein